MWFFRRPKEKKTSGFVRAKTVYIQESVILATEEFLREMGPDSSCHEQVVYWAGRQGHDFCAITTVIKPRAHTSRGSFRTSALDNAQVIKFLAANSLELVSQVHSHPGNFIDHSDGDDEMALMPFEGFLSVIVRQYARYGMRPLMSCGIHRFEGGEFRRLTDQQINEGFRIVPTFHRMP